MDVFNLRDDLVDTYRQYATSFMRFRDPRVGAYVEDALASGMLWPHPSVGLNPSFEMSDYVDDLVDEGVLHPKCRDVFRLGKSEGDLQGRRLRLRKHQADAVGAAADGRNYVLTTGTGSGKSLAYIIPIVDHVLRVGSGGGVKALVVYPMNALVNSQREELEKFLKFGPWGNSPPVTFERYTGQDREEDRERIQRNPPDVLLTNYVMLELILTRFTDRRLVEAMKGLQFLVLDELHTYRGRQGADVALLVRRLREATQSPGVRCVGTSATLSTEGDHQSRLGRLADVSSRLFGAPVLPSDIIGETLQRVTPAEVMPRRGFGDGLAEATRRAGPPADAEAFVADPLSCWIENTFGIREGDGRLVRADPLPVTGPLGAAKQLAEETGVGQETCARAIRTYLLVGNTLKLPLADNPVFPFRLHQFISRGDTVYATPEPPATRELSLSGQRFVPGSDRQRVLLPLVFCRMCGQDYYMAHRQPTGGETKLTRRSLDDNESRDNLSPGFLYASEEMPWPDDPDEERKRLPPDWFDPRTERLRPHRRDHTPQRIRVAPDGTVSTTEGTVGWWVPAPFRFCLACGVSHSTTSRNDFPRLSTLGAGGRASATTVMSLATVQHLQDAPGLESKARKLLSFTDNRQDASLQAGHFNDFVEVTMLRSAVWRAVQQAGDAGIKYGELPGRVFDTMALPREWYAGDPDQHEIPLRRTDKMMRRVLEYRLYRDFERGWRITQPNLEQVGLLRIDYENLPELASDQQTWDDCHPALVSCPPERREHVLRVLLDYLRQELGLYVDVLHPAEQESLERYARQHLKGAWSLRGENLLPATEMVTYPKDHRPNKNRRHVTSRSLFGRFLRRSDGLGLADVEDTELVIGQVVERLRRYSLLKQVGGKQGREVWQVPAGALVWKAGDGTRPYRDYLRVTRAPETIPTNRFFVELYRNSGEGLVGVEAREHTAQVSNERRIDREERFRSAVLPVLYCSPTMELGVDISLLNVVNMRNVPPTPANYAQRSGRAGRSGQPALVFTYCSSGNSHDQHFFRQQHKMVSGQVEAPRVDLANEDLLRAHVHAVWLATSGLSLGQSMSDILDMGTDTGDRPELQQRVWDALQDQHAIARARQHARAVLADLETELKGRVWWYDRWLDDVLTAIPARFQQALERWMALYMAAWDQFQKQSVIAVSPSRSRQDQKRARRLRDEAERQLDVLRAKSDHRGQSDFYTYRYFASEGFLPGYSFPRLPLSAFIPGQAGQSDRGDYVQRPRFLAISEFGPQTYIYHEGARYRITRVLLSSSTDTPQENTGLTEQAKRCDHCGYMHPVDDQTGQDICGYCEKQLGRPLGDLLQMRNVSTRYWERITSDEERRRRMGYELISGVEFVERQGRRSVNEATVLTKDGEALLGLSYGDTATIWRVNLGWRRRKNKHDHGFYLDMERGEWSKPDSNNDRPAVGEKATTKKVIPFVKDSRNSLLVEPAGGLPVETMASLGAALKAAIQVVFQLEPNELAVEPLPTRDNRRLLLVYESAEGGAGALRQLVDDPKWWQRIAAEALKLCHTNTGVADGEDEGCGAACYECLLTYQNQLDHELLDRTTVIPMLRQLVDAQMERHPKGPPGTDSSLEKDFIGFLASGGYRMPDGEQVYFPDARTRPDYVYNEACAAIYIDGPDHDYPDRAARDRNQDQAMLSLGYRTIRFHHGDDWSRIVTEHKDVFGTGHRTDRVL